VVVVVLLIVFEKLNQVATRLISIETARKVQVAHRADRVVAAHTLATIRRRASAIW